MVCGPGGALRPVVGRGRSPHESSPAVPARSRSILQSREGRRLPSAVINFCRHAHHWPADDEDGLVTLPPPPVIFGGTDRYASHGTASPPCPSSVHSAGQAAQSPRGTAACAPSPSGLLCRLPPPPAGDTTRESLGVRQQVTRQADPAAAFRQTDLVGPAWRKGARKINRRPSRRLIER